MDPELLLQLLDDPEMAQALAQMSAYKDTSGLAGQQSQRADVMRYTPSATGSTVGQTYVAASPLEHLGVALRRIQGEKSLQAANAQQQQLIKEDVATRKKLAQAMADAMRRQYQTSTAPPATPPSAPQLVAGDLPQE